MNLDTKVKVLIIVIICFIVGFVLGLLGEEILEISDEDEEVNGYEYFKDPYDPKIEPSNFISGVNHTYFPLIIGKKYIFEGDTGDGLEHIEVIVTNQTRIVMGVTCMVVRDTVSMDGEIIEDTYDWYAQDIHGNVWYMGEDSKEYEEGEMVSTEGSWEAGIDGAKLGIIMLAKPFEGLYYRQEFYKGEAEDMGAIIKMNDSKTVKYGSFDNVLVIKDYTPLEPGIAEYKYFAPGIGVICEEVVEGGSGQIELIGIE